MQIQYVDAFDKFFFEKQFSIKFWRLCVVCVLLILLDVCAGLPKLLRTKLRTQVRSSALKFAHKCTQVHSSLHASARKCIQVCTQAHESALKFARKRTQVCTQVHSSAFKFARKCTCCCLLDSCTASFCINCKFLYKRIGFCVVSHVLCVCMWFS